MKKVEGQIDVHCVQPMHCVSSTKTALCSPAGPHQGKHNAEDTLEVDGHQQGDTGKGVESKVAKAMQGNDNSK